jgi:hypothetical protein
MQAGALLIFRGAFPASVTAPVTPLTQSRDLLTLQHIPLDNNRQFSSIIRGAVMDSTNALLNASDEEISAPEMASQELDYDAVAAYTVSTIDDA